MNAMDDDARLASGARNDEPASASSLLGRLATDVSELMRGEVHLARAEIKESLSDAKAGVISLATGAIVLLAGLPILLGALAFALAAFTSIPLWVGFLIVGLVVSGIGAVMLMGASKKLSAGNLALSRTSTSLERDSQLVKEHAR